MPKYETTDFTFRPPRDIGRRLNDLAERTGETRNSLLTAALARYLDYRDREEWKEGAR